MELGCTYLIVTNMAHSIAFYEALLNQAAVSNRIERWAQIHCGNTPALWNPEFDQSLINEHEDVSANFNDAYLKYKRTSATRFGNNFVLNFNVPDLNASMNVSRL